MSLNSQVMTTQILTVGVAMEAVMATDMVQDAEETVADPVAVLERSQFKTQRVQLRMLKKCNLEIGGGEFLVPDFGKFPHPQILHFFKLKN